MLRCGLSVPRRDPSLFGERVPAGQVARGDQRLRQPKARARRNENRGQLQHAVCLERRDGLLHPREPPGLLGERLPIDLVDEVAGSREGRAALAGLTTRESTDYAITVLELFAAAGDVLTFYSERIANEQRALEIARGLSADVDREITAIITTLETLATAGSLATGDFAAFQERAAQ